MIYILTTSQLERKGTIVGTLGLFYGLFLGCLIKRSKTWACALQQIKGLRSKVTKRVCGSIFIDYSIVF